MASAIPSDHYKVLGVAPDADAAAIKTAYRKLVLKCHPDKVSDPALKEQKQDEFQQVQQSYETLSDPDKRQRYDLELRVRELREEKDRARASSTRSTPTTARTANVRVSTNPDYRSPHTSPPKMTSYKTYSGVPDYKTRTEHIYAYRPKHSHEHPDMRSSRSASDEKLRRDDYRDSRESKRREDDEYRRAKKEKDEYERRRYEKSKEKDRDREAEYQSRAKAEKKPRERERERDRERRKQQAEDAEKARSKPRSPYVEPYYAEDVDDRKSRKSKSSLKKESSSSRDKSSSKIRDRSSAREDVPLPSPAPELPIQSDVMKSKLDFAASYIQSKKPKQHVPETPNYTESYPDPSNINFKPQRRTSGETRRSQPDTVDGGSPSRAEFAGASAHSPPRLQKTYTAPPGQMYTSQDVPASHAPRRATLNRAQTMEPEYYRHKSSRGGGRSSMEDSSYDDHYVDSSVYSHAPAHISKYNVRRGENQAPRVEPSWYGESTATSSNSPFGKVKTSAHFRPENVERTRSYGVKDAVTMDYQPMFSHPPSGNAAVYAEA